MSNDAGLPGESLTTAATAEKPQVIDATDANAERLSLLAPRAPQWAPITFEGKRYAVVRPKAVVIDQIVSRTQQQVVQEIKGQKKGEAQQEFKYSARYREAWAVVACLHVMGVDGKPGQQVFYKGSEATVQELLNQPYEPDGLLSVVGDACVRFMSGRSLTEEVEVAKNA